MLPSLGYKWCLVISYDGTRFSGYSCSVCLLPLPFGLCHCVNLLIFGFNLEAGQGLNFIVGKFLWWFNSIEFLSLCLVTNLQFTSHRLTIMRSIGYCILDAHDFLLSHCFMKL